MLHEADQEAPKPDAANDTESHGARKPGILFPIVPADTVNIGYMRGPNGGRTHLSAARDGGYDGQAAETSNILEVHRHHAVKDPHIYLPEEEGDDESEKNCTIMRSTALPRETRRRGWTLRIRITILGNF